MARGVPKAGFRAPRGQKMVDKIVNVQAGPVAVVDETETDSQIETRIRDRFEILDSMTVDAIDGDIRALIVSGPAGLGKSYTVEQRVGDSDRHKIVRGYVRATGLVKLLYSKRHVGQVLVLDDADEVFGDEISLGILKAACDSTDRRIISYLSEGVLLDEDGEVIPKQFQYNGSVIFITNMDFDNMVDRGHRLAPHLNAMISRAHYIDLKMKTRRDYMIRIRQVVAQGLLKNDGLCAQGQKDVIEFIEFNSASLRELSLRIVKKIGALRRKNPSNWKKRAYVTCCR